MNLDVKTDPKLMKMENPYDTALRYQYSMENGVDFRWDTAFYNGKYYVYFGVVPVILCYLPFYVLTGIHLPHYWILYMSAIAVMLAIIRLLYVIIKKYYPGTLFSLYIVLSFFAVNSCGTLLLLKRTDFYSVPIMMALMFTIIGIDLWCESLEEGKYVRWKLVVGSICMALVAG